MRQTTDRLEKRIKSRQLNMPGGIAREFESLKAGDPTAIEMAVRFLEADPWYFRSGYHKADFLAPIARRCIPIEAYAYAVQAKGRLNSETRSHVPQTPWLAVDFGVQQRAKTWCPVFDTDKQTGEELYLLAPLCRDARDYGKAKVAVKCYLASSEQEHAPNARLLLALCRMMTETLDDAWQNAADRVAERPNRQR